MAQLHVVGLFLVPLIMIISWSSSGSAGTLECERLPVELCALSVSSGGLRCVLETSVQGAGNVEYFCQTSDVKAEMFAEWVEDDWCMAQCGVGERTKLVGLASDAFIDSSFRTSICSDSCRSHCPNIVHLYRGLALGEGVALEELCTADSRRQMLGVSLASLASDTAPSPTSAVAPSPSQVEVEQKP